MNYRTVVSYLLWPFQVLIIGICFMVLELFGGFVFGPTEWREMHAKAIGLSENRSTVS